MALFTRAVIILYCSLYVMNVESAVISSGVKLKVSKFHIVKKETHFRHKKREFVYSGVLKIDKEQEIFFTFDQFKILLRENKIALGGVAGGGGGK